MRERLRIGTACPNRCALDAWSAGSSTALCRRHSAAIPVCCQVFRASAIDDRRSFYPASGGYSASNTTAKPHA